MWSESFSVHTQASLWSGCRGSGGGVRPIDLAFGSIIDDDGRPMVKMLPLSTPVEFPRCLRRRLESSSNNVIHALKGHLQSWEYDFFNRRRTPLVLG